MNRSFLVTLCIISFAASGCDLRGTRALEPMPVETSTADAGGAEPEDYFAPTEDDELSPPSVSSTDPDRWVFNPEHRAAFPSSDRLPLLKSEVSKRSSLDRKIEHAREWMIALPHWKTLGVDCSIDTIALKASFDRLIDWVDSVGSEFEKVSVLGYGRDSRTLFALALALDARPSSPDPNEIPCLRNQTLEALIRRSLTRRVRILSGLADSSERDPAVDAVLFQSEAAILLLRWRANAFAAMAFYEMTDLEGNGENGFRVARELRRFGLKHFPWLFDTDQESPQKLARILDHLRRSAETLQYLQTVDADASVSIELRRAFQRLRIRESISGSIGAMETSSPVLSEKLKIIRQLLQQIDAVRRSR